MIAGPYRDVGALSSNPAALMAELARREPEAAAARDSVRVVRAPGRVNLIGEHTDYNDGLVLPAAIDRGISIAFIPTADENVVLTRIRTDERIEVRLGRIGAPQGAWADYVAGIAWALRRAGAPIQGFRGIVAEDLPMAAGLSSSAALELAVAWALGGGGPPMSDRMEVARLAQRAENDYVGVPCGLMDQFAVAMGAEGAALLLDCRSLAYELVPLPDHVEIVICHSGVSRRLAASGYERRRAECREAITQIQASSPATASLRDVDLALLEEARPGLDDVLFRRARHVITENLRVEAVVGALRRREWTELPPIFAEAQASLRDDFEVSTPELDRLVEIASRAPGVLGARLTGAGFGGATVNLGERDAASGLMDLLRRDYRTPDGAEPSVLRVRAAAGVGAIWPAP